MFAQPMTALSAPSLVFSTSGSFISASVLPRVTLTTFFFQFTSLLPCFLQNDGDTALFGGEVLLKDVSPVSAST